MARALLAGLVLVWAGAVEAQTDPIVASREEYREAVTAYESHDYAAFLEHSRRAEQLRPLHGGVIYALASAYALTMPWRSGRSDGSPRSDTSPT